MTRSLRILAFVASLAVIGVHGDGLLAAPAIPAGGACQAVVLRNGFTVQYSRSEVAGAATRLWLCADAGEGYVEVPNAQIEVFEEGQNTAVLTEPPAVRTPPTITGGKPPADDELIPHLIAGAALRHQIDPDFVASVVKAESDFVPTAVSPKGARGLMQLMPQTAAFLGVENALDPAENVEGGTAYLGQLLDRYDGDAVKALAAYNAGPQRVEQYGGVPPYPETRAYIIRIIDDYNRKKLSQEASSAVGQSSR